jgi:hypothetical protein
MHGFLNHSRVFLVGSINQCDSAGKRIDTMHLLAAGHRNLIHQLRCLSEARLNFLTNIVCDDRETAATGSRARGLYCRIERKNIGLKRDACNRGRYIAYSDERDQRFRLKVIADSGRR